MARQRTSRVLRGALCAALAVASAACGRGGAPDVPPSPRQAADGARSGGVATAREWQGQSAARVEELFEGRFPGVRVLLVPGGLAIRIRGSTSLMGTGDPLYIMDGFPIEPGPGGLITLNPSDIARIEVLKDAGSIAAYGSRGANGVILISTRRND